MASSSKASRAGQLPDSVRVLRVCPAHPILLAEDDAMVLSMLVRLFDRPLWRVIARESGRAALEAISRGPVDIIIADIDMPRVNGIELCRHLCGEGSPIPTILTTGRIPDEVEMDDLPSNVANCIHKPLDVPRLPRIARLVLAGRECGVFRQ